MIHPIKLNIGLYTS